MTLFVLPNIGLHVWLMTSKQTEPALEQQCNEKENAQSSKRTSHPRSDDRSYWRTRSMATCTDTLPATQHEPSRNRPHKDLHITPSMTTWTQPIATNCHEVPGIEHGIHWCCLRLFPPSSPSSFYNTDTSKGTPQTNTMAVAINWQKASKEHRGVAFVW